MHYRYAYQVDGATFSTIVGFEARAGSRDIGAR
jgi:hypothetical protein